MQSLGIKISEYHTYEILPEAIAVSKHHFPFVQHRGNLIGQDFTKYEGFDLLLAGTCCQSLSRVRVDDFNMSSGLKGKSKIFYEAVRALREINPKWFMFENVIPSNSDDLRIMTEEIGIEPILLDSADFSAQSRKRYYWTNIPLSVMKDNCKLVLSDIMENNVDEKYFYKKDFYGVDMDKRVCATLNVNTMEMKKRIYNPSFKCCTLTCVNGGYQECKVMDNGKPRKLTAVEYERLQGLPDNFTNVLLNGRRLSYSKRCSLCGNGWNVPTIEFVLRGMNNDPTRLDL